MELGQILQEQYRIDAVLSEKGGFGIVYLGTDLQTSERVAVKEIKEREIKPVNADATQDPAENKWEKKKERFLHEAQVLEKLKDIPQVVKVYSCRDEGSTAYIVMEYLDGKTLKDARPQGKKFPPEEAYGIIRELLSILIRVHGHGVLHRDIAPDNIFLLSSGKVKLFDFGFAQTYKAGEERKDWIGAIKRGYSSLEQMKSYRNQGPWSDVYSAAATYYEMLTGEKLPEADNRKKKDTIVGPVKAGAQISAEEEAVLLEALRVDAKERIQTADEFLLRLEKAHRKDRKKKIRFALGAAALLLLCVTGAVFAGIMLRERKTENAKLQTTLQEETAVREEAAPIRETEMSGEALTAVPDGFVAVPDVVGMEEREAADLLGQQSLTYSKIAEPSLTVPKGKIIRQEPAAGTETEEDSEVQIVVSLGDSEEGTTAELVTLAPRTTQAPATTAAPVRNNNVPQATQAPQTAPNYAEPPTIGDNIG